jgi:hypothetical protein
MNRRLHNDKKIAKTRTLSDFLDAWWVEIAVFGGFVLCSVIAFCFLMSFSVKSSVADGRNYRESEIVNMCTEGVVNVENGGEA